MPERKHHQESGFALLVVFLLAAFIAIGLYRELPRVVLEAQRDREEMLIDRGTQYKRGIQLYFRRFGRYPPDLDALENSNNMRFLRRRYKDPLTGEDEWRLIHAAGPGIFTDSLVYGQPGTQQQEAAAQGAPTEEAETPVWLQRRPSDMVLTPGESLPASLPEMAEPPPSFASQPVGPGTQVNIQIPAAGQTATATLSTVMQPGGSDAGEQVAMPEIVPVGPPGASGEMGTQAGPQGPAGPPGAPIPSMVPIPIPAPVISGGPQQGPGTSNPAMQLIQQLLTSPTPRAGAAAAPAQALAQQPQIGGIAGVASKREAESIKVYNERTKYNEWEFVYDVRQDPLAMAALMRQGQGGQQAPAGGVPGVIGPGMGPGRGGQFGPGRGRGGAGGMGPGRGGGRGGFGGQGFGGQGGFGGAGPIGPGLPAPQQPGLGRGR